MSDQRRSMRSDPLAKLSRARSKLRELAQAAQHPDRITPGSAQELTVILDDLEVTLDDLNESNRDMMLRQRELTIERRRYQEMFESAPIGYLETDRFGIIREANTAVADLLGATTAQLLDRPLATHIADSDRKVFRLRLGLACEGRTIKRIEVLLNPRHRDPFPASLDVAPVSGASGEVVALRWLVRDASDEHSAETAKREREARMRLLLEHLPEIAWTTDSDLRITALEGSGVSRLDDVGSDHIGKSIAAILGEEEIVMAAHRAALAGEPRSFEVDVSGQHFSCVVEPLNGADGESFGCVGVAHDFSARRRTEITRAGREARLDLLLEQIPAIVWSANTEMELQTLEGAALKGLDLDPAALIGQHVSLVFPASPGSDPVDGHRRALLGESVRCNATWSDKNYELRIRALKDTDNETIGCVGTAVDVSAEHRSAEALMRALEAERISSLELQRMNELKDLMLTTLSHDILNGLTVVIGFSGLLEEMPTLESATARRLLHNIGERGRKLERVLNDLLHLDRLDGHVLEPSWADTDVTALLRRAVANVEDDEHPITCEVKPLIAKVSTAGLERIVENLLDDAIKHTPPGTAVWVRAEPAEGQGIMLIVEDAGPGIPDDMKATVFEPFRRVTDGAAVGHGVGLSIVARFAELHGGRAWVEDRPGGGASFHVLLPGPLEAHQ